jgi:hypothetical protein
MDQASGGSKQDRLPGSPCGLLPLWLYMCAVLIFPAPGVALLLLRGQHAAAFLIVVGNFYAAGLGRSLLWRRLGQPPIPAARQQWRASDA